MHNPNYGPLPDAIRIGEPIHSGAVGALFHVTLPDGTPAVLKRLPGQSISLERSIRFGREVALMSKLEVDGVPEVTHYNDDPSDLYIVMCHAPGVLFEDWDLPTGVVRLRSLAEVLLRVLRILQAVHAEGILHRDLSATNIKVDSRGQPWVLDFGLAILKGSADVTSTREAVGTPLYMSPEQARGVSHALLSPSSDLYSLALLFLGKVRGKSVRKGSNLNQIQQEIGRSDPESASRLVPGLPTGLANIFDVMLANHPADRFATAEEAANAIQAWLSGDSNRLPQMPVKRRLLRAWRRPTAQRRIVSLFLLTTFLFLAWRGWVYHKEAPQRAEAQAMALPAGQDRLQALRELVRVWPNAECITERLVEQTLSYQRTHPNSALAYDETRAAVTIFPDHTALRNRFLSEAVFRAEEFADPFDTLDDLRLLAIEYPDSAPLKAAVESALFALLTSESKPIPIESLDLIEQVLGPAPESAMSTKLLAIWNNQLKAVAGTKYPDWGAMCDLCLRRVSYGQAYRDAFYPDFLELIHLDLNGIYRADELPARLLKWSTAEPRLNHLWLGVAHRLFMAGYISWSTQILSDVAVTESSSQQHRELARLLGRWLPEAQSSEGRDLVFGWAASRRDNEKWHEFLKEAFAITRGNKGDSCALMWLTQLDKRNDGTRRYKQVDLAASLQQRTRFAPGANRVRARLSYEDVEDARELWEGLSGKHKLYPAWHGLEVEVCYAEGAFESLREAAVLARAEGSDSLRVDVLDAVAAAHLGAAGALDHLSAFLEPHLTEGGMDIHTPFREDPAFVLWLAEGFTACGLTHLDARWLEVKRRWHLVAGGASGNLLPVSQFALARRWGLLEESPLEYAPEPEWVEEALSADVPSKLLLVPEEYPTIQSAIDEAESHSRILVQAGEYHENLWIHKKELELVAQGKVVLSAASDQAPALAVTDASRVKVVGLTMSGGGGVVLELDPSLPNNVVLRQSSHDSGGGGAFVLNSQAVFVDCNFINNGGSHTASGGGVAVCGLSQVLLSRCAILGNEAWRSGGGLLVTDSSQVVLRAVQVHENRSSAVHGRQACVSVGRNASAWLDSCSLSAAGGLPIATSRNAANVLGQKGTWYLRNCQIRGGYAGPGNRAF